MTSYKGWQVGDYAIRKNRLCRLSKIHFDEFPPHVTVEMLDDNNEIGTEFAKLRHATEEEIASMTNTAEVKLNGNQDNTVVNTDNTTDIDVNVGENTSSGEDIKGDSDVNIGENDIDDKIRYSPVNFNPNSRDGVNNNYNNTDIRTNTDINKNNGNRKKMPTQPRSMAPPNLKKRKQHKANNDDNIDNENNDKTNKNKKNASYFGFP